MTQPLALSPAPEPRRPRVLLVGTALGAVASFMVLAGMLGAYLAVRSDVLARGDAWLPAGTELALTPANMGLFTLLMSAVVVQWAVYAMGNDDRPHAYLAIGLALVLGVAHIVMQAFYWSEMGLVLNGEGVTTQAVLILAITGTHLAMVVVGLLYLALMGFRALGGQLTGSDREGITAAAMYWYVTIAAFSVVWYAIFITK